MESKFNFRKLEEVANATPKDYLRHAPKDPVKLASTIIAKAQAKWPRINRDDGVSREEGYDFLIVGPGSGLVIQALIDLGHRAFGLETSRRGIASAPDLVKNYILWAKPWELPFPSRRGENPTPFKMFHIAVVNRGLKELLNPMEYEETLKEVQKVSQHQILYQNKG